MRTLLLLFVCLVVASLPAPAEEMALDLSFRLAVDAGDFMGAGGDSLASGSELRRARVILAGQSGPWDARLDVDLAGDEVTLKDAFVRRHLAPGITVRLGHVRAPFGCDPSTSTRDLVFFERSLALDGFGPGRRVGLEGAWYGRTGRVAAAVMGHTVGLESSQPDSGLAQPNQAVTWAGRGTLVPWRGDHALLHVGASGVWRQTQEFIGVTRYRTGDEIHLTGLEFLDTGWIYDVNHIRQGGAELLALKAGWRLQGEYTRTWTMRNTLADLAFDGAYVQLSHLWGTRYRYRDDKALVGRVKPENGQAWEAGLRWSWVDMNDQEIAGSSATVWTVGGSWYPDQVVRISVAWLHVDHDEAADGADLLYGDLDYDAAMVRCRVAF